jgi:hypothetical protein
MASKNKKGVITIRTLDDKRIHLTEDRITEPKGKGVHGQTFYALYSDIREAYAAGCRYVPVKEINDTFMDGKRDFGRNYDGKYHVGCRAFSKKTFEKILYAAGCFPR